MRWLIASSLRLAAAVVAAALVVLALGIGSLRHAAVDTLPEFLPPQVQVQTEALGLSTAEVEQLITVPLEDEFNGLAFLDHMRSQSVPGLSSIELTFKPGTDILQARQLVTERVAQGPAVVNVGTPPVMVQPLSAESRAMMIGLSSTAVSPNDLSTLARWQIRPRLLAVPGVANVTIWGQRDQQLQVLVDPSRLHANGVSLSQVINTTGDAMWTSPLTFVEASSPGADGFIDTPNQRLSVQHVLPIRTPADLAKVPIEETPAGSTLRLGDVATVVADHPALRGDAVLSSQAPGGAGLLLVVEKFPGANTLAVDRGVEQAMAELRPGLGQVSVDTQVYRTANYLDQALANLGWSALAGLMLLTAWFGLAWRSWRAALLALVAVALPLTAAAWILQLRGSTFTLMTLAGLAAALVVVVDDAVRAVAAQSRTPVSSPEHREGETRAVSITEALLGVRRPLRWALAAIVLGSVPLLLVTGSSGQLIRPVLLSYLLAVVAATGVSLTVTPALCWLLLRPGHSGRLGRAGGSEFGVPPVPRWIVAGYDRLVPVLTRSRAVVFSIVVLLAVAALAIVPQFGTGGLMPVLQDRSLLVQWSAAPGTSLPAMRQTAETAGGQLRAVSGVSDVASNIGQALLGDQVVDVDSAQTWITIGPHANYGRTVAAIRHVLSAYPGVGHQLLTYAQTALAQAPRSDTAPGTGAPLTVRVYGTDWATLRDQADALRGVVDHVPGVNGAVVHEPVQEPSILIATNVDKAAAVGLKPGDVRRATAVLVSGIPVGSYYQQQQIFDVSVWGVPAVRSSLGDIQNLMLDTPGGGQVPLKDVADVTIAPAPTEIDHDQASRYLDITAEVHGQDLGTTVARVQDAVRSVAMPLGYHAEVSSGLQQRQSDALRLILVTIGCAVGVLLLFQAALGRWTRALLLLVTLPLSLSGGALTALIAGHTLGAGTLIGFWAVLALAIRAGLVLLSRTRELEADGGPDPVLRAARTTAFPTLVTAVGLILLILPFAVRGDIAGLELLRPLALVVIGGTITSTLVTLVVLPALTGAVGTGGRPAPAPGPGPMPTPTEPDASRAPGSALRRLKWILALVAVPTLAITGCTGGTKAAVLPAPALLEPTPSGSATTAQPGNLHTVVLTPAAWARVGIQTVPVRAADGGLVVPFTAVIFDPGGTPWVYVPVGARSYLRHPITITRYTGDQVVLSAGPTAGTPVVVTGAAELLGTEYGVGEE